MKKVLFILGILVVFLIFWFVPRTPPEESNKPASSCDTKCEHEKYMREHPVVITPCGPDAPACEEGSGG